MSIKFGWTGNKPVNVESDPFNGAMVLTLKALSGTRRQCEFSAAAISELGLWQRTNGLEEHPEFTGKTISKAFNDETNEYFLFVNDSNFSDVAQININKTNCGFSDKELYNMVTKMYNLDNTKDNHILLNFVEQDVVSARLFKIDGVYMPTEVTA